MFRNYFKTAWRNLAKRKFYSLLNILGLSLGILCALFLFVFVSYNFSFDRYHKNASSTYKIVNEIYLEKTAYISGISMGMFNSMSSVSSNIKNASIMLFNYSFTVKVKNKQNTEKLFKEDKDVSLISADWFKMFDYVFVAGNANELKEPNTAVITQTQANKYFGNNYPIGNTILFPNNTPIKIIGVVSDKPYNSDLKSNVYISLSTLKNIFPNTEDNFYTDWSWINTNASAYITLNNVQSKTYVEAQLNALAKQHLGSNAKYYHFTLQPLEDIHFESSYGGAVQKSLLIILMIIGCCILVIASVNYINLSIAQQAKRMAEIGVRKVLGSTPLKLFFQFIIETLLTVVLAIVIAVITMAIIFPGINSSLFAKEPIHIVSYGSIISFVLFLIVILTVLSGFYPAFVLSRMSVNKAFKNLTTSWKAGLLRKTLLIIQNSMACILIICTIIMLMQVNFLKHTQIGFNSNAVVMLPLPDSSFAKKDLIRNGLAEIPQIRYFSFCHSAPSSQDDWGGSIKFDNRINWETWQAKTIVGDASYVRTFALNLIAGRNISQSDKASEFLINQRMVAKLGLKTYDDAIGKSLVVGEFNDKQGTIVGVVKDFNTQSLTVPIEPTVIVNDPEKFTAVAVKLNANDLPFAVSNLRKIWEQVFPDNMFEYQFTDDQINNLYLKEDLQQKLIWMAATVAITISCLGLLGLVSLVTLQRTKEIGIRKVLGASTAGIVRLITNDFLKLISLAVIIAIPLGWYFMNVWLEEFAYHIKISWWVFAIAAISIIIVAFLTISFQAINAATANPVKSLKTE